MRKLSASKTITLGAMCAALGLLCLYAAAILPTGRLALYFMSSLFVYVLACEGAYLGATLVYFATAALALIVLPDRMALLPYVLLLGHYGIFKTWFDLKMPDRIVRGAVKLLYCDIFLALGVCLAIFVLGYDISALDLPIPVWALIPILQVVFLCYDILYWMCQRFYLERIRSAITPRR